jgi:hypothetical protein
MIKIRLHNPIYLGFDKGNDGHNFEDYICYSYEIIEEDKKIEKISCNIVEPRPQKLKEKLNELIDVVNKLRAVE